MKFNITDLVANPDDYTSNERAEAARAVNVLIAATAEEYAATDAYAVARTVAPRNEAWARLEQARILRRAAFLKCGGAK